MRDRAVDVAAFLSQAGWDNSVEQTPLSADFSNRRYARLERSGRAPGKGILMDADPDQRTGEFIAIGKALRGMGLSAPEVYIAQAQNGLLIMEDFGDRNFGRLIDGGAKALPLCRMAVDVLSCIHANFDRAGLNGIPLPVFDSTLFTNQAELFLDGWLALAKRREPTEEERQSFREVWWKVLQPVDSLPQTLMLRDFMPDNLMDVPARSGVRAVGLLDFQDGGIGPMAYDLASLCEEVRRDGGYDRLDSLIGYYLEQSQSKISRDELRNACHLLLAQRHTRILGILARRLLRTGQADKLIYSRRVWLCLESLMKNESLAPVRAWMDKNISLPERDIKE